MTKEDKQFICALVHILWITFLVIIIIILIDGKTTIKDCYKSCAAEFWSEADCVIKCERKY